MYYSLIVSSQFENWAGTVFRLEKSRFLEYTNTNIYDQLLTLSNEAIGCLTSWPCIIMNEGRAEERVHIARILDIQDLGREISVTIALCQSNATLQNDFLWRIRNELDIEQFEFNRNHWAVKEKDLISVLTSSNYGFILTGIEFFSEKPLPAPSRASLIEARDKISDWTHTEIDDFLLEAGVPGIIVGREVGSRRDRANAILKFAFDNPSTKTAENSLFSVFIYVRSHASEHQATIDSEGISTTVISEIGAPSTQEVTYLSPNRVFIVHGQNSTIRDEVSNFLVSLGLEPIILHEQANMGRHLLTKFIDEADLVTFAVILMTDDDIGSIRGGIPAPRARQNVILELGYFLAHLGQAKVCALISPGLETPSDFDGIVYIQIAEDQHWKQELRRELVAAQMPVRIT